MEVLFADPVRPGFAGRGKYQLQVKGYLFEPESTLDIKAVCYGQVYGWMGTDYERHDLSLPMLWGMPVALAFGFLGAIATAPLAMFLAAVGVWFGGWVDDLIQRISEISMTVPVVVVVLLIFLLFSKSVWAILGALVLLNSLGSPLKNYRAAFLPIRNSPYIEAALAQGASDWRIIGKYLVPRVLPIMTTQVITMVPTYVYYEATLAVLYITDPALPSWGKVISQSLGTLIFLAHPHRILIPIGILMFTGLGFALLGFAMEHSINPRLAEK